MFLQFLKFVYFNYLFLKYKFVDKIILIYEYSLFHNLNFPIFQYTQICLRLTSNIRESKAGTQ